MRGAFDAAAPASQGHFVTMLSRVAFIEATLGQNVGSKSDSNFHGNLQHPLELPEPMPLHHSDDVCLCLGHVGSFLGQDNVSQYSQFI